MFKFSSMEQYDELAKSTPLELEDGTFVEVPPRPDFFPYFLGDEQADAYDELLFEIKTYDRDDDGAPIRPFQKDGALVKPSHNVRVVKAALGEDAYAKLRAGGGKAADVWKIWAAQAAKLQDA